MATYKQLSTLIEGGVESSGHYQFGDGVVVLPVITTQDGLPAASNMNRIFYHAYSGLVCIEKDSTGWWTKALITPPFAIPSGFAPDNPIVSGGLLMWLEPSGYVLDGATASGIASWTKKAGIITTPTLTTNAGTEPFVVSGIINGYPSAYFGGIQEFVVAGGWKIGGADNDFTLFAVAQSLAVSGGDSAIWGASRTASANPGHILSFRGTTPTNSVRVVRRDDAASLVDYREPNRWDSNWNIWTMAFSGTSVGVFKNGLMVSTSGMNVGTLTLDLVTIGATRLAASKANWFVGYIPELVCYSSGCGNEARVGIENYLSSKYRIPIAR